MISRTSTILILLLAASLSWCQVDASGAQPATAQGADAAAQGIEAAAQGGDAAAQGVYAAVYAAAQGGNAAAQGGDQDQMLTPPPVSGGAYSMDFTSETRANYLRAGLAFNSAYSDNIYTNANGHSVGDASYSIWPSIALDEAIPRLHFVFTYSPGFTFYQRNSNLNQANQNLAFNVRYRLSPHVTLTLADSLQKTSSILNQPSLPTLASTSGSLQPPTVAVVAPTADMLSNNANALITYQFSASSMVGASGTFTNLHYPNTAQVPGLYGSNSMGGSAFYNRRLSVRHYLGTVYQYSSTSAPAQGVQTQVQTQSIYMFYTIYVKPTLIFSVSGGGQHSDATQSPLPSFQSWSPTTSISVSWRGRRTSFAAGYARVVSAGGGLVGAYHSNAASASMRWQLTRDWNAAASASYSLYHNLTPDFSLSSSGGHTISGGVSVQRGLGEHMNLQLGYTRLHQSYSDIAAISTAPDTNREFVSLSYQFTRPFGR